MKRARHITVFSAISLAIFLVPQRASEKVKIAPAGILSPLESAADAVGSFLKSLLPKTDPLAVEQLKRENEYLRGQMLKLHEENRALREKLKSIDSLRGVVDQPNFEIVFANVLIGSTSSNWRSSVVLSKGTRDGIRDGALVVYNNFVVGKVSAASFLSSKVALVTDPAFRAAAVLFHGASVGAKPDGSERQIGVVEGSPDARVWMKWLSTPGEVDKDTWVVTAEDAASGIPRGLVVGRVKTLSQWKKGLFRIDVEPMVNFQNLETVMVMVPKK